LGFASQSIFALRGFFFNENVNHKSKRTIHELAITSYALLNYIHFMVQKEDNSTAYTESVLRLRVRALNSHLNPHFVFNAISAIQNFVTKENKTLALKYLSAFSRLLRFYLKHLDNDFANLKEEIDIITWYLQLQKLRYKQQLSYNITTRSSQDIKHLKIPSFLILTLVENIIENGVYNQFKNQNLNITFNINTKTVLVNILYIHKKNGITLDYLPEYRNNILQWQEQVKLLNDLMNYNIKKDIIFLEEDTMEGCNISLVIPIITE